MPNIKEIQPLSNWLEIELPDTRLLDPPIFRVRVKPSLDTDVMDCVGITKPSEILVARTVDIIQEWDLTNHDHPIPCTDEEKKRLAPFLRILVTSIVKGGDDLVASKIVGYAQDIGNFLKN